MNAWQKWLLLRTLVVFTLGCALFIFVALAGLHHKHPDGERETEARTDRGARFVLSGATTWRLEDDDRARSFPSNSSDSTTHAGRVVA
jgi:hypothetical protein